MGLEIVCAGSIHRFGTTPHWEWYVHIFTIIFCFRLIGFSGDQYSLIVGNPGIGKSWFLFYLMKLLLEKGETVIYQRHTMDYWVMFANNQIVSGLKTNLPQKELSESNTWYLIDTDKPSQWRARTVMVSSPCKEHYKEFVKLGAQKLYMPIWTYDEIRMCCEVSYYLKGWCQVCNFLFLAGLIPR